MENSNVMYIKGRIPGSVSATSSFEKGNMDASVIRMPQNISIGKSVQAQVVSINGQEIELLLNGNSNAKITAKVTNNLQVSLNQILNFEVIKSSNSVTLRPLFENLTSDKNIIKALKDANLPLNKNNIEMVGTMMQRSLPINRQALLEMNQYQVKYPETETRTLVEMKALEIPITDANIEQFTSYKGTNHYVSDAVLLISEKCQEMLSTLADNNQSSDLKSVLIKLSELLEKNSVPLETKSFGNNSIPQNESVEKVQAKDSNMEKRVITQSDEKSLERPNLEQPHTLKDSLQSEPIKTMISVSHGNLAKLFTDFSALDFSKEDFAVLKDFFKSEGFLRELHAALEERVLIGTEEFEQKEEVRKTFAKLTEQMNAIGRIADDVGQAGEQVEKATVSVKNNIEFMNILNQAFSYIQIPLRQRDMNGKGELFVYARKQNKKEANDELSAILHLDMKNLGEMDIHVKLNPDKVITNFYVETEEILDFLEPHFFELDTRLNKRGYQVETNGNISTDRKNSIEMLTEKEREEGSFLISESSFDARA